MKIETIEPSPIPVWTWAVPLGAVLLLLANLMLTQSLHGAWFDLLVLVALLATVFASVHHAEVIAHRLGEPFGSLVLAAAVTIIEVALIVSVLLTGAEGANEIARDTVFAAVMIVLNGIVGLCLLSGGLRYHEQGFQIHGATGALGVIGTLATLALILPNFTEAIPGPVYSSTQLFFVGSVSLILYGLFLFVQTMRHREDFLDGTKDDADDHSSKPAGAVVIASAILLPIGLTCVIFLAKSLTPSIEFAVLKADLPPAFVGVVIAAIVLFPEGLSALRAAKANNLQTSLNLALGSALASIGMTIPAVAAVSLIIGMPLALGLEPEHIVLLVLSLFICTLTLATGRTTVLQGGLHLVIFAVFLVIAAVP
ncbi:Sodium-potassium/proton antiporter ChaA [Halioglobus japonicus]|nr:Sodium-potassium/proton antiporter ChaA [Halioglobus japonicus]